MSERRYSPLATLFAATFLFRIGNAVAALALPWFVLSHTKSAAWAGATAASSVIATIIGAWVGGGLVDRFGRAPVALISGVVGGVAMASIPLLDAVGALSNTGLIACVVLGAAFDAPGMAAQDSELPKLGHVAGLSVERVSSLKAVIGNVAILGGPALEGRNRPCWRCANARADGVLLRPCRSARRVGASRACRSDDDHDGDSLHARRRRFLWSEPLRPLFGIVMIFVGIVGANNGVIMPALFVDAGRQVAELGLFSSMMGAGGLLGIAIHASVGARISAQNWLAVAFVALRWARFCFLIAGRAGADVVGRARGTADRLSLSILNSCHLQPHAARTSRPGTRHGLGGDAVSLAHGYACGRRVCRPCWSAPTASLYRPCLRGSWLYSRSVFNLLQWRRQHSLRPNPYRR